MILSDPLSLARREFQIKELFDYPIISPNTLIPLINYFLSITNLYMHDKYSNSSYSFILTIDTVKKPNSYLNNAINSL
jgi:hypothetical protein